MTISTEERLQAVGILRQALKPLLVEANDDKATAKVAAQLLPLLERIDKHLDKTPSIEIPQLNSLLNKLDSLSKSDKPVEIKDLKKVSEDLAQVISDVNEASLHFSNFDPETFRDDPTKAINVRLTDGEKFIKNLLSQTQAVITPAFPFRESAPTQRNVALHLVNADGIDAIPVASPNGSTPLFSDDGSAVVSNVAETFRSGFAGSGTQPNPADWTLHNNTSGTGPTDHLVTQGGNAAGSSYLRISMSPFVDASEVSMVSVPNFGIPIWPRFGISISQRISGQEVFAGLAGVNNTGAIVFDSQPSDVAITGANVSIASNVATITITNHPFHGGDRVVIYGCTEPRLNVGPVVVTVVDQNTITVPCTLANGSYSAGGNVRYVDPLEYAHNGGGFLWENTTVTNASLVSRRNGSQFRTTNETTGTTTASQTNASPFTDAFNAGANNELLLTSAEMSYRSFAADGIATPTGLAKYTQGLPDEGTNYAIYIRARNLKGMTMPVGRITAIAKTGTTTATVTTDVPHGLTTSSQVQIYGVLDQTNFPNLTVQTAIASIVDTMNFTVVIGTATTTSSSGGVVWNVQGSTLAPGVIAQAVQSISCTSNVLTVIGSATWATPLPGEYMQLWGMQGSAAQYDGAYKVLGVSTTTLWLAAPNVTDFGSINTGGALFRRTDVRIHFVQTLDYSPLIIEGGRGNSTDINNSLPTSVTNTPAVTISSGTVTTVTSMTQMSGFILKDTLLNAQDRSTWANAIRARIT